SPDEDLAPQSDVIAGGTQFDYTLKAQSVTSFVGAVTGPGPAYAPADSGAVDGAPGGPGGPPNPTAGSAAPPDAKGSGAQPRGTPTSGLSCSLHRVLTGADAGAGALGAAGLVLGLALARRRRSSSSR
ncbi:MAG: hypothetical protein JOZ69_06570, partial [Myxococcales bacterium]|nr:hypothetical protein [Myxococcales bacterium]